MERRLAAVLIADVVGYGRLSQVDEEGTRLRFQVDLREIFEPVLAAHHGRLVKTMGDGILVEFQSVVDALRCAVEIQQKKAERNAGDPADRRLDFRIAINLGDIIVEGDDIQGDGVNIADRLQALAPPGGIVVSGTAYDHVKTKLPVGFASLGLRKVKSIAEPVRVYRVVLDSSGAVPAETSRRMLFLRPAAAALAAILVLAIGVFAASWSPWPNGSQTTDRASRSATDSRPSVVVLPFDDMTDSKEQTYLASGFTEDLTTELARIPGIFVVSRNAATTYDGKETKPAEIAAALHVRYLLEGSIRRIGDDIRINAQLIDGSTAGHLWAERFDGDWADVFRLQDRVIARIADTLKVRLVSGQIQADFAGGTRNPAAYEAYLRAKELKGGNRPEDIVAAVALFRQAVAVDPDFGEAWAELAWTYWDADGSRERALGLSWREIQDLMYACLEESAKNPSATYYQLTSDLLVRQRRSDEAIASLQKAIVMDPSHPWTYLGLSQALIFNGKPQEGRAYLDAAMKVDPGWDDWRRYQAGLAAFGENRFEDAIKLLEEIDLKSADPWPKFYGLQILLSANGHLGRGDRSASTIEKLKVVLDQRGEGELTLLLAQSFFTYKSEADIMRLLDGLRKAGVPDLEASDLDPENRLSGAEIESLVLRRERRGHRIRNGVRDSYLAVPSPNGGLRRTIASQTLDGTQWVQDNFLCTAFPVVLSGCGAIFRNPSGTGEQQNEYVGLFRRGDRIEFSVTP